MERLTVEQGVDFGLALDSPAWHCYVVKYPMSLYLRVRQHAGPFVGLTLDQADFSTRAAQDSIRPPASGFAIDLNGDTTQFLSFIYQVGLHSTFTHDNILTHLNYRNHT